MDRATKIYAYVLLALGLAWVIGLLYEDPQVAALNRILAQDAEITDYPYRFHVLRLEGATAVMGTPRSPQVPVHRILGVLHPEAAGKRPEDPAFQAAQKRLATIQGRARERIVAQPNVNAVRWELDGHWLQQHGIPISPDGG